MWHIWTMIGVAFAVSLDSFSAGVTYGLRRIRIPISSILIIAGCSGLSIFLTMLVGDQMSVWLSPQMEKWIGASILILLGCWTFFHYLTRNEQDNGQEEADPVTQAIDPKIWIWELPKWGLVIQILKKPTTADIDHSGSINATEAILLGIALSLDSLGAGLGVALLGYSPFAVLGLITLMCGVFLRLGMWIGFHFQYNRFRNVVLYLPSILLIILGLVRIW
ncbi:sporulation membrane protein YtaF [Thermoactinomyces sp. DSM 45892]|uniref:sporulation membrane protein YtaF n=1 Tax=Thermoactinomyces sp. DSM 45892 TaxID=1882753 RepID=UPI00089AE593|nr:sporulation membrane protein YtaF [Thermoactinomyces sp. DSM 45892]SDZ12626.1 putative sporulation protein YtaF [Thermoactinomyces sp. DSM 45892]